MLLMRWYRFYGRARVYRLVRFLFWPYVPGYMTTAQNVRQWNDAHGLWSHNPEQRSRGVRK